jgi:hypothetical protein
MALALAACSEPSNTTKIEDLSNDKTVAEAVTEGTRWVTTDRLTRHTCPSKRCGIVGIKFFREGVVVLEEKDGWARITKPYFGGCAAGKSDYVDSGNAACTRENGFDAGEFAEWVDASALSEIRPPDPAEGATGMEVVVGQSDDYRLHKDAFVAAARSLISSGRCTKNDFEDNGGWMKSMNNASEPVYFIYCGGLSAGNKIYLNASSGRIY